MTDSPETSPVYVVLGAAGGVGADLCRRLVAAGASVLVAGRASDRLTALAEELRQPRLDLDATKTAEVEAAFAKAAEEFGRVDGAANCVGSLLLKAAHQTSDDEWDATITTNLRSAFATTRAAAKTMRRTGGSVVLVASAAARLGFANHEAIAAAKAGVIGLTLSAAATYAPFGVRFNAVAPGLVKTPLTEPIWSREAPAAASLEMHALGRFGEPGDVAATIAWLLGPESGWITGEVLSVDGGLSRVRSAVRRKPG